jgi:PEP-CTERM motif
MTTSTLVKSFAVALTAAAIYGAAAVPAGAATITLTNHSNETDVTLVFTATATESFVLVEGYQVNDIEKVTNNTVTLSSGGPNLLGSTWQQGFAAVGSNSFTFNDGTSVPGLGFAAQNPPDVDTFYQAFATVVGQSYTYSFDYSNNTGNLGLATNSLLTATASSVPEASTWAMLLFGFAGLGLAGYRVRRVAASIA